LSASASHHLPRYHGKAFTPTPLKDIFTPIWAGPFNQRIYKLFAEGQYQEAIPLAEKAVEIARRLRGFDHPDTAFTIAEYRRLRGWLTDLALQTNKDLALAERLIESLRSHRVIVPTVTMIDTGK
jgi:Domain of unknown function (DUF4158)/Tetratricopeptide repeat